MNSGTAAADTLGTLSRPAIIALSIATGVALELGVALASSRREAWDSPIYWTIGLPAAGLAALLIGFAARRPAWVWTVLIAPSQVLTMMVRSGEIGNLWPVALVLSSSSAPHSWPPRSSDPDCAARPDGDVYCAG